MFNAPLKTQLRDKQLVDPRREIYLSSSPSACPIELYWHAQWRGFRGSGMVVSDPAGGVIAGKGKGDGSNDFYAGSCVKPYLDARGGRDPHSPLPASVTRRCEVAEGGSS